MDITRGRLGAGVLAVTLVLASAAVAEPAIQTGDVDRFFRIYDAARGKPSAEALQREYLDQGSEGLKTFAKLRRVTGDRIAEAIAREPGPQAAGGRA